MKFSSVSSHLEIQQQLFSLSLVEKANVSVQRHLQITDPGSKTYEDNQFIIIEKHKSS